MLPKWKALLSRVWKKRGDAPVPVTEATRLGEIRSLYPAFFDFLKRRYAISLGPKDTSLTLGALVKNYGLPSAPIVFMELQLEDRAHRVRTLPARDAADRVKIPDWRVLDVREPWEHRFGSLPKARGLDETLWSVLTKEWEKDTPILLYCHFGIRSLDAANQLMDEGFTNVHVLQGGIDAWSLEVDPSLTRYEGSWC